MTVPASPIVPRAVVTGGTGAIGRAIVEGLVRAGMEVIMPVRDKAKGDRAAASIAAATGTKPIVEVCDLSRKSEVFALATRLSGPLDVLVNNAAECPRRREETREGIERQLATNVLGYFWMMTAFAPHLEQAAPSRIVNVASYWAGGLNFGDLEFKKRNYDNDTAYRQSKQADRMLTAAFAARFLDKHVAVNACHPGDVRSKLSSDLGFGGHESPEQGAATPLFLALDDIGGAVTGRYFARLREDHCPFMSDKTGTSRLYDICASYL